MAIKAVFGFLIALFVIAIVGGSVMIGSFRNTVADWLGTTLGADIYISPPQVTATRVTADVDPAIAGQIAAVPGVVRVATARSVNVVAPDYPDLPPVNLTASSGDVTSRARTFVWVEGEGEDYWSLLDAGGVMLSEAFAFRGGLRQTDNQIQLVNDRGEHAFTVVGLD